MSVTHIKLYNVGLTVHIFIVVFERLPALTPPRIFVKHHPCAGAENTCEWTVKMDCDHAATPRDLIVTNAYIELKQIRFLLWTLESTQEISAESAETKWRQKHNIPDRCPMINIPDTCPMIIDVTTTNTLHNIETAVSTICQPTMCSGYSPRQKWPATGCRPLTPAGSSNTTHSSTSTTRSSAIVDLDLSDLFRNTAENTDRWMAWFTAATRSQKTK